jgi:hypothetical protein
MNRRLAFVVYAAGGSRVAEGYDYVRCDRCAHWKNQGFAGKCNVPPPRLTDGFGEKPPTPAFLTNDRQPLTTSFDFGCALFTPRAETETAK